MQVDQYIEFAKQINRYFGIDLLQYKRPQMERRILSLMRTVGVDSLSSYVQVLREDRTQLDKFMNHLTINVSEFYRNPGQWEQLERQILPELLKRSPNLKVWSAGCSSGEEPYTIAMILNEVAPGGKHQIIASDIDTAILERAQEGRYHIKSVAGLPEHYFQKYFQRDGEVVMVKPELKKIVKFKKHDLLKDPYEILCDLIICRNVVIYFTEEAKNAIYRKFYQALKPGGVLFIGSTEQIFQAQEIGFKSVALFFYQKAAG